MLLWSARAAALVAVSVACYLTLSPDPTGAGMLPDWVGHLGIFASVGASFALLRRVSGWKSSQLRLLVVVVLVLAVATEAGQAFTGRDPDLGDLVFDIAGGLIALAGTDAVLARLRRGVEVIE